ncbi:FHA domain-containing protein [Rhynchospora pubera]|uniref:FHA domain-containing protein n=1 Tax=Rhynchospora pubera TaxID=906938 RepID=A0AAV8DYE3_9POAL|nr:FHA domain-containing protein [Rhynchospora pubera]KAJ4802798.1 FHA domain-containing protein [Rhynchospora pubera]
MEAPILQVTVLKGPRNGEILVCEPDSTIHIGRVIRGNNLALRDPGISQKHLCFRFVQADSRWVVSDLDTSNGTILNGSPIQPSVPVPVSDGDVLEIGEKTKLGVKIVVQKAVEGNELGNDVRGRRVTRRSGSLRVNSRADSSRVSEEKVELKQDPSKVSAPVRGRRNNARAICTVNDEEKEALNSYSGVEMGHKGAKRGREDVVGRNAAGVLNEEVSTDPFQFICSGIKESDQDRGAKLTRNPRKHNSSRVLKEVDTNCLVDSVLEVKEVEMKKKGMGRAKGKGKASTVSEKENDVNIVINLDSESGSDHVAVPKHRKGKKARINADSSTAIEGEGEENVSVEEKNCDQVRVDIEKMTLKDWFESMERFLSQEINDDCERLIGIIKENARKFDELVEAGSDMA